MEWLRAHRLGAVVAAVVVVVGLGLGLGLGLSSGGGPTTSFTTTTVPPGATSSIPGSGSTTPADTEPSNPSSTIAGVALCTLASLQVSLGPAQHVTGHEGFPIVFTSTSHTQCQLAAYPTVTGYTSSGSAGQALAQPGGFVTGLGPNGVPGNVVLTFGKSASAGVEAATSGGKSCQAIQRLTVAVPGSTATTSLSINLTDCFAFLVHPFVPGTTGS